MWAERDALERGSAPRCAGNQRSWVQLVRGDAGDLMALHGGPHEMLVDKAGRSSTASSSRSQTGPSARRAAARVRAELLRGARPGDDRRDRRGALGAGAAARRARGRRPQPLGLHVCRRRDRALVEALVAAAEVARERIDLREHEGAHPRIGVADVVPIVALRQADMERARQAALDARRAARRARLPRLRLRAAGARAGVLPPRRRRGAAGRGSTRASSSRTSGRAGSIRPSAASSSARGGL